MKCGNLIQVESIYQDLCHTGSPAGVSYLPEQGKSVRRLQGSFRNGTYRYLPRWQDVPQQKKRNLLGKAGTHQRAAEYSDKRADIP